jgi:hypothetical protein
MFANLDHRALGRIVIVRIGPGQPAIIVSKEPAAIKGDLLELVIALNGLGRRSPDGDRSGLLKILLPSLKLGNLFGLGQLQRAWLLIGPLSLLRLWLWTLAIEPAAKIAATIVPCPRR